MGRRATKSEFPVLAFKSPVSFGKWLAHNHAKADGIWLRLFKKASGEKSITYDEALDEALCFGWIDGQVKSYDALSWIQKFTPRRRRSVWSKRNTGHVDRLTREGRMKAAGLAEVDKAKADGRWEQAYESPANTKLPDDFLERLSHKRKAQAFFESLNKANKYAIAWRLYTAKKPETRERRMQAILTMLAHGEKFH